MRPLHGDMQKNLPNLTVCSTFLDRGVKERPSLCVLRETMMPAVLVELGFIDSADVWLLKEHQEDMAKAVALGIMDFWKTV